MHPDFERFARLSDGERLVETTLTLVGRFGPAALAVFSEVLPVPRDPPGLRALVAPDGVTVRVLRGDEDPRDVWKLVLADVAERYVRPKLGGMVAAGASPAEVDVFAHQTLLDARPGYRVELLCELGPGNGGRSRGGSGGTRS